MLCGFTSDIRSYWLVFIQPGIESRWGRDFPHLSRPALWPTLPTIQWVPGLSQGKIAGAWCWPSAPSSAVVEINYSVELYGGWRIYVNLNERRKNRLKFYSRYYFLICMEWLRKIYWILSGCQISRPRRGIPGIQNRKGNLSTSKTSQLI